MGKDMVCSMRRRVAGVYAHRVIWILLDRRKLNAVILASNEAVSEVREYLFSKNAFLKPSGELRYGVINPIVELVLNNITGGMDAKYNIEVRPITSKDIAELSLVMEQVSKESPYIDIDLPEVYIAKHAAAPNHLLVLTIDSKIIGFIALAKLKSTTETAKLGMAILSSYSGQGYGKLLIEKALTNARLHKLNYVELNVSKDNYAGIKLYTKCGFKQSATLSKDPNKIIMIQKL